MARNGRAAPPAYPATCAPRAALGPRGVLAVAPPRLPPCPCPRSAGPCVRALPAGGPCGCVRPGSLVPFFAPPWAGGGSAPAPLCQSLVWPAGRPGWALRACTCAPSCVRPSAPLPACCVLTPVACRCAPPFPWPPTAPACQRSCRRSSSPVWCSPVPAPSTDTRADPASARRAAEAARGRVGRAGGPLWCGPSLGAWGLFPAERLPTFSRLIAHFCSDNRPRTSLCAPLACLLHRRPPPKGRAPAPPGPPSDRPPQSASVEGVSRLA